jgi:hypothetical protein
METALEPFTVTPKREGGFAPGGDQHAGGHGVRHLRCAGNTQIHSGRVHERALPITHPSVRCLHQREAEVDHVSEPGATRRRVSTSVVSK